MAIAGISNGTMMYDYWMPEWCFRCTKDHWFSHIPDGDGKDGCEILVRAFIDDENIPEIIDRNDYESQRGWDPRKVECRLFDRCSCGDEGGEAPRRPTPPDPNQFVLFDVVEDSPWTPGGAVVEPVVEQAESPTTVR